MHKKSAVVSVLSIVAIGMLLLACGNGHGPTEQTPGTRPTEENFASPVVSLNRVEMPYYTGWWYFKKDVEPTKGDAADYGAPLALAFVFDIQNPNAYPVMMDGFKFTVAFEGIDVNTVNAPDVQWIPAGKTNQVRVTAITDARAALLSLLVTGGFKLKERDTNVWEQLESWWIAAKDYSLAIEVKEGSAIFKADSLTNVVAFSGKFSPE